MSNKDIMLTEGFLKVYTAGNMVYEWLSTAEVDKME